MSNILIIKHGALGDIIQANGAIKDIKKNFPHDKVFLLTTPHYAEFLSSCPYVDGVLIDQRLPRWNLVYLLKLKKKLERFAFTKIFDLQNSSRTQFYKKYIFKKNIFWSNSKSFAKNEEILNEKRLPVLSRMKLQLGRAGIKDTSNTQKPDLNWAIKNINNITNKYFDGNYILVFPFCSPKLTKKKWPYYHNLIKLISDYYGSRYSIGIVPGPNEIEDSKKFNTHILLNQGKPLSILELISVIKKSSYVISNDTGPAHICNHLNVKGLALFGSHTTPEKVSLESENFKSIKVNDLKKLKASEVFEKIRENLD